MVSSRKRRPDYPDAMARRDQAVDSRDLILTTAQTLIAKSGYDGMAISDLCQATGLPASSIYYHFGSKMGVLAALLDRAFTETHAVMPDPSSFSGEPLQRFENWFTAACDALDQRPEYLRLLLAVSIGGQEHNEDVRATVQRIREYGLASWVEALTPVFPGENQEARVHSLALIGRSLTDGTAVAQSFEHATYASQVQPFVALIRALAAHTGQTP
jgi:AcrR family transcriptional regulator